MRVPGWIFIVGILTLVGGTALCSLLAFGFSRQTVLDLSNQGPIPSSPLELVRFVLEGAPEAASQQAAFDESAVPSPTPVPTLAAAVTATPSVAAQDSTPTVTAPTATADPVADNPILTDPRRKTVLLMGMDEREGVTEDGPPRTDTMILISADPVRKTAGVLSLPRDLWVDIPGFETNRINTAYAVGEANAYPGGGGTLAAETVQQLTGMRIDRYVMVNFQAFLSIVNLVAPDGVEICVREVIDDPHYPDEGYGTIHIHFDPGCQRLDAERLLQYARTRVTFGGDFDRARRQQEVLDALRAHLLSLGGIRNFVAQAPAIWEELKGSYKTNLTLEEIIGLGMLMGDIPRDNIQFGVIDNLYVDLSTSQTGDKILIPKPTAIIDLVERTFNPQTNLTLADLRTRAEAENAQIVVFNNTDIAGLARQTSEWLGSRQVDVAQVGNVPTPTNDNTVIRDYTGRPWTARYLAALLNLPPDRIEPGADGLTALDVMVVVGPDIQPLLNGQ